MKKLRSLFPVIALFLCFNPVSAQEEITAKRFENAEYYVIQYLKFEEGKMEDAKKIINEHFLPTDKESGSPGPVMELELVFGEWDYLVIWKLEEGLESLNWQISPSDVKWFKTLQDKVGGAEKAREIMDEFGSYIKSSKSEFARQLGQ